MTYKVVFVEGGIVEVENVTTCDNTEEVFYMRDENSQITFLAPLNQVAYIVKIHEEVKIEFAGNDFLKDLETNVDEFKLWKIELKKLTLRSNNGNFVKEYIHLGPKCLNEIIKLNELNDEEFAEYCKLWKEKQRIEAEQLLELI